MAEKLGFEITKLDPYKKDVELILDFIKDMDQRCHEYYDEEYNAFAQALHISISSDLRSLIILAVTHQNFQMNIVLRHFIEVFIVVLWIDIGSQFTGGFDYFLDSKKWKPYRTKHRVYWEFNKEYPNRSIRERLERIRLINDEHVKGKDFYKKYFSNASPADLRLLLSLPICNECRKSEIYKDKINYRRYHLDSLIIKKGKEDRDATYKTDFRFVCTFCKKQKLTKGYVFGVPTPSDMICMLKAITDDDFILHVGILEHVYNYLSDEFVHFGTSITPDRQPTIQDFGGGNFQALLWGLEGVNFCLKLLKPLMNYYFH